VVVIAADVGLRKQYAAALRVPPWFSNLLPEGPLRQWIADERGVSLDREMELLAQVGHDLPGAVQILPTTDDDTEPVVALDWSAFEEQAGGNATGSRFGTWRFSLAGVALKFSMLAQGDRVYPHQKYAGSFETVAALAYRGRDRTALREFVRRLAFSVLVGNGDAHLKNWSLVYPDRRVPTLSPAYDLVSTFLYRGDDDGPEDLGLRFCGTKRFEEIRLDSFALLERRLEGRFGSTGADLVEIAAETAERLAVQWPKHRDAMSGQRLPADALEEWIQARLGAFRR